jgi:catechol 2,3-dioxygenase-like lactoylglutathione lyase family enzyme
MTAAQTSPALCVEDIERTARFYGVTLGFDVMFPRGMRGGLIVFVRGGGRLYFRPAALRQVEAIAVRLDAANAHALAQNLVSHGIAIFDCKAGEDGTLEAFSVCDPDGHRITLTTGAPLRVVTQAETAEAAQTLKEKDALFARGSRQPRRWLFDWRMNSPSLVFALQAVGFMPSI